MPTTLALQCSHRPGSIAVIDATGSLYALRMPPDHPTTEVFAQQMRQLLESVDLTPRDVELVTAETGPGSFTGLRIAVTFAKSFAYATNADLVAVSTMDLLAEQAKTSLSAPCRLKVIVNAYRGKIFAAEFRHDAHELHLVTTPQAIDVDEWLAQLQPDDTITGPHLPKLNDSLPDNVTTTPPSTWMPTASTLAILATTRWQAGVRDDLWKLVPHYIRKSAAEEKLS